MKKHASILILFILLLINSTANAQDIYRTQNANMKITAVSADTVITIISKEVLVLLHYENARFTMKMDKSTFYTGNDSLDRKLTLLKYDIIEYAGKLGLDRIDVNGESPINFIVEGVLSTNNNIIKGTGHLEHIANRGMYSSLITLEFNVKVNDLGLNIEGLNLKDDIQIEIIQEVLNNTGN